MADLFAKPLPELRPYQQRGLDHATGVITGGFPGIRRQLYESPTGTGKAAPVDSFVYTPTGYRRLGSLRVGDRIFTADGTATTVTGVFPQGVREIVRVTFSDEVSVRCDLDHLWNVQRYDNETGKWLTKTARELQGQTQAPDGRRVYRIPTAAPIAGTTKTLPVDPWLIGYLLGNASLRFTGVVVSTKDPEMIVRLQSAVAAYGAFWIKYSKYDWRLKWGVELRRILTSLAVMDKTSAHKFVPEIFLHGDRSQRLDLLRGLMDSDGTVARSSGGIGEFGSSSVRLAEAVQHVVRTLGGLGPMRVKTETWYRYKGERKQGLPAYTVSVNIPDNPFSLIRKAERYGPQGIRGRTRMIESIEPDGTAECVCISVAHPSRLYLMDHCVVTHNTLFLLKVYQENPGGLLVVQTPDVAAQFGGWLGLRDPNDRAGLEKAGVWTVMRLRLTLSDGKIDPTKYRWIGIDEAHHQTDATHQLVEAYLAPDVVIGATATSFRGTLQETAKLHAWWENPVHRLITIKEAVDQGYMALPTFDLLPLVDDETIDVSNGEFTVSAVESAWRDKLQDLAQYTVGQFWRPDSGTWDRPTMVTLTSIRLVERFVAMVRDLGADVTSVTGQSRLRKDTYKAVEASRTLLVQIKAVGEGTDLKLRRLIDAAPTMSPVFWMQRVGRITRPTGTIRRRDRCVCDRQMDCSCGWNEMYPEPQPQYIGTNHNFMRHGWLWAGVVPRGTFTEHRKLWGDTIQPSRRAVARVVGLDGLGRFKPSEVPLRDGGVVMTFQLGMKDGRQWCVILHPADEKPIVAERTVPLVEVDGKMMKDFSDRTKARWVRIDKLPDVTGATSIPAYPLTPGQKRYWQSGAKRRGLNVDVEPDARRFQILPVLDDIRETLR